MILVDTSVWIAHLRGLPAARGLVELLDHGEVLSHTWVIGELALGNLGKRRASMLADMRALPSAPVIDADEVLAMIEARALAGTAIGWVDAQLLASSLVAQSQLWTLDGPCARAASRLGLAQRPDLR